MLGMAKNMHNNSYFPDYYYTRDLVSGASCNTHSLPINDQIPKDSPNSHNFSIPPYADEDLVKNKEIVKQTMLKQDAIFKDQVHELHRVYGRQRELMNKGRRIELLTDITGSGISQSATDMAQTFSCQKENHIPALNGLKPANQYNALSGSEVPSTFRINEFTQASLDQGQKSTLKYSDAPASKCKKIGKKLLDLELPADEYIDSDEGESAEEVNIREAPEIPSFPVTIVNSGDVKTTISSGFNSVSEGDSLLPNSSSHKRNWIADLNESIEVEEEVYPVADEFVGLVTSQRVISYENMPEKPEAISKEVNVEKVEKPRKIGSKSNSFSQCLLAKELHTDSKSSEMELKQACESPMLYLLDQSRKKIKGRNRDIFNTSNSKLIDNSSNPAADDVPQSDVATSVRVIVQALPSLANSAFFYKNSRSCIKRRGTAGDKCQRGKSMKRSKKLDGAYWKRNQNDGPLSKEPESCEPSTISDNLNCKNDKIFAESGLQTHVNVDGSLNSSPESKDTGNCIKYGVLDMNLVRVPASNSGKQLRGPDLVVKIGVDNMLSRIGNQFDLNKCMNEDESSPLLSFPMETDIKGPISPENKEGSPARGESDETQLETRSEDIDTQEAFVRMAAEAIVAISLSRVLACQEKETRNPSEGSERDSLHWFANIVSSVTGDLDKKLSLLRGKEGADYEKFLSEEIDYFEVMTLNLPNVKGDEYLTNVIYRNEELVHATKFQTQPRKGRTGRRAKQQKEFEDKIIHTLSSLSGYEEDTIKVTGNCRRTCYPKKARKLERGRESRRSYEKIMQTEVKQTQSNTILNLEESCEGVWGKINRRRRGPRTPINILQVV